jgi:hypothetical protein
LLVDLGSFHSRVDNIINDSFNYAVTRHRWNCQELKYIILRSTLIHVLAHFQRTTCSQIYFRFSSYLLRKLHLFVILTAIRWFILNIQSDLFWHRCLYRQAFGTPRMYTLSPSKSIKGSNYGEFLKDKNVLLYTWLYKYAPNLESLLTQQYVCVMCTLWSDNTCIFTHFHSVKNANTQLIWSSDYLSELWLITLATIKHGRHRYWKYNIWQKNAKIIKKNPVKCQLPPNFREIVVILFKYYG